MKFSLFLLISLSTLLLQPDSQEQKKWKDQLTKYSKIYSLIKEHYPQKIDDEKIIFSSIRGFLRNLDPHSYFLDPVTLRSMNEDQQGNYYGIGTRITKYEDRLTIIAPLKDTPAYRLGILPGDIIVEIDGESTQKMSLDGAMKKLRGGKGTTVTIKIERQGLTEPIIFEIERAEIPLNSISYAMTFPGEPEIGYISIRTFGNTTREEFKDHLNELVNRQNVKTLVIDLRGNAGGSLYAAIDIADFFLEKGKTIVSLRGRNTNKTYKARRHDPYEDLPVVVLINRGSASASEIVAAALQFHQRAVIVGSRSWGKGLVETVHKLSMNCALALTTAKYYTPANTCIQRDFTELDDYLFFFNHKDYDTNRDIVGGVFPDQYVKPESYSEFMINLISKGIFFQFSRSLIDQKYPIGPKFKPDKKVLRLFRNFLTQKGIQTTEEEFDDNLDRITFEVERNVISNKFSIEEGYKVFLRTDSASAKAVDILLKQINARRENGEER